MSVRIALPAGESRAFVHDLLVQAGVEAPEYAPGSRVMRAEAPGGLVTRVFRERDIPVQVALGNYDLGICGETWLAEVQVRFPMQRVVRLGSFPGPVLSLWLGAARESGLLAGQLPRAESLRDARIVSEFPNLAEFYAINHRIPGYHILPIAGSAEAYPPEDADLVVMPARDSREMDAKGLVPITRLFDGGLVLLANEDSLRTTAMGGILRRLGPYLGGNVPPREMPRVTAEARVHRFTRDHDLVRMAVPDGHAQRHTPACLRAAGLEFDGYSEDTFVRRPAAGIVGLQVKVVRPQDMPQLVAMGMFDIAITGRDLLHEHRCRFPGSPVDMAVDLGRNRYRIGPVVDQSFPVDSTAEAVEIWRNLGRSVRIASEFPATAERFARESHLPYTSIIPIAGASEGFVPEDADILVEGTETGASIRANGLKMLDPFMESTNCVIWRRPPVTRNAMLLNDLVHRLQASVADGESV
ncbi:MAG: ATP phosphoribosyltransferase [Dehalococcoidia bacterium]